MWPLAAHNEVGSRSCCTRRPRETLRLRCYRRLCERWYPVVQCHVISLRCPRHSSETYRQYTLCLKKTTLMLHTITSMHINRYWSFLADILLSDYAIEWWFVISSLLTNVSALPGKTSTSVGSHTSAELSFLHYCQHEDVDHEWHTDDRDKYEYVYPMERGHPAACGRLSSPATVLSM